jgi:hypothetical protein
MDITKCNGEGCIVKEKCYRYTAPKGEHMQSWVKAPFKNDNGLFTCELFWGERSELLLEQLKNIMNGSTNIRKG